MATSTSRLKGVHLSIADAAENEPLLSSLLKMARLSSERLEIIRPFLPHLLRNFVKAGSPIGDTWCLIVPHSSAAMRIKLLSPLLLQALNAAGHNVRAIDIKIIR